MTAIDDALCNLELEELCEENKKTTKEQRQQESRERYVPRRESPLWFQNEFDDTSYESLKTRAAFAYVTRDYATALDLYKKALAITEHRISFKLELQDAVVRCAVKLRKTEEAFEMLKEYNPQSPDQQLQYWYTVLHACYELNENTPRGLAATLLLLVANDHSEELWRKVGEMCERLTGVECDEEKSCVGILKCMAIISFYGQWCRNEFNLESLIVSLRDSLCISSDR